MHSPSRKKLGLATGVLVAGAVLIGWVARSTRAQESKADLVVPAARATEPKDAPGQLPSPLSIPATGLALPPAPTPVSPDSPGPTDPPPAGPESDDPEKRARDFTEQNRKAAQEELTQLKAEAERLRARLGKVEAGIRRWEALVTALGAAESENARVNSAAIKFHSAEPATPPDIAPGSVPQPR
jgi:hypothetical protein